MIAYESEVNGGESHIALVRGDSVPGCPAFHEGPASASPAALQTASPWPAANAASLPHPSWCAFTPDALRAMSLPPTAIAARSSTSPCA
jgi:hypothetical protein